MHLIVLSPQYLLLIEDSYQSVEPVGRSRITAHITLGHYMCAPRENSTATILSCKMASSGYLPYKEPARPSRARVTPSPNRRLRAAAAPEAPKGGTA